MKVCGYVESNYTFSFNPSLAIKGEDVKAHLLRRLLTLKRGLITSIK
jgi:hypothetical protein